MSNQMEFENIPLKDNWMFSRCFSEEKVFRAFIEALLEMPVGRIEFIQRERVYANNWNARGIRVDVYAKDSDEIIYNIEMQCRNEKNLLQRIRYYQAQLDSELLQKGEDFIQLNKTLIIFICDFDFFGDGYAKYTRESIIEETGKSYDDGSRVFILNTQYSHPNANMDIVDLLSSLDDSPGEFVGMSELATFIKDVYRSISCDSEERRIAMTKYDENMLRSNEEGYKKGSIETFERCIAQLMQSMKITRKEAEKLLPRDTLELQPMDLRGK